MVDKKQELRRLMPEIKETHKVLTAVKQFGEMPKNQRHLFSRYHNKGLLKMGYKSTPTGAKVPDKVILTKKGKGLLESFRL